MRPVFQFPHSTTGDCTGSSRIQTWFHIPICPSRSSALGSIPPLPSWCSSLRIDARHPRHECLGPECVYKRWCAHPPHILYTCVANPRGLARHCNQTDCYRATLDFRGLQPVSRLVSLHSLYAEILVLRQEFGMWNVLGKKLFWKYRLWTILALVLCQQSCRFLNRGSEIIVSGK